MAVTPKVQQKTKTATHSEVAQSYVSRRHADMMHTRGRWYKYSDGVWLPIHDEEMAKDIWQLLEQYESQGRMRPSLTIVKSVTGAVRAYLFVREDSVDAAPHLINLTNGMFDLNDGKMYKHSAHYYQTTQLPFAYDPKATAPLWEMYLVSTFIKSLKPPSGKSHVQISLPETDHELIEFVQEAMGYSLTTSVEHHAAFWCVGEGANGKGVLFHVLEQLGGTAAVPLNVGRLHRDQYQLAALAGKRIALCSESGATKNLVEDAIIKALISGDTMDVRQIRRPPLTLHPTVKLWWSMNDLPAVADTSEGFWRRMRIIPFNNQFQERDRILDLKERLGSELPGIFLWTLEGLKRLRQRGGFASPAQVTKRTQEYKAESNPVALFIDACCTVGAKATVQSSMIYDSYKYWCLDNTFKPLSSKNFKREMERLHFFYHRTSTVRRYLGLKLRLQMP